MPFVKNVRIRSMLNMYHDEIFKTAFLEAKDESISGYKDEVTSMEKAIQKFFNSILECSSELTDKDFELQN